MPRGSRRSCARVVSSVHVKSLAAHRTRALPAARERSRQATRLLPGGGETGCHVVGLLIALEFIPAAGVERPDPARANRSGDVPKRCPNPFLWIAVYHRELVSRQLALHDIIDEGERLLGFEHPAFFASRLVMAALTLSAQLSRPE